MPSRRAVGDALALFAIGVALAAGACSSFSGSDADNGGGGGLDGGSDAPTDATLDSADTADAGRRPRIYVFGGNSDGTSLDESSDDTYYAEIREDGLLGPWQEGLPLPRKTIWASAAVGSDFVVLPGGLVPGGGETNTLLIGTVAAGVVTGYAISAPLLVNAVGHAGVVMHDGFLYVIGGKTSSAVVNSVQAGGMTRTSQSVFTERATLPGPLTAMAVAASNSALYIVGGLDGADTKLATISMAPFEPDGGLSNPVVEPQQLPTGCHYTAALVYGTSLLVAGGDCVGQGSLTNVRAYTIDTAGHLEPPRELLPLPAGRSRHGMVVHEKKLYVVGGRATFPNDSRAVFVATLDAKGDVDHWEETASLPVSRMHHATVLIP